MAITVDPKTTLYASPYFDDYDEDKKYVKVLFRPGVSVQTRELTQLQTILQKQIERFGKHMFQEGSMVIPGNIMYDLFHYFVKIRAIYGGYAMLSEDFLGYSVSNSDGAIADVIDFVQNPSWDDGDTETQWYYLYLKYRSSGDTVTTFSAGDVITSTGTQARVAKILEATYSSNTPYVGTGSAVNINEGVYYARGYFIKVDSQKIFLDMESNAPSYRVGLKLVEEIYTETDDISLTSNATGSPNYTAPGAHRLRLDSILHKIALGDDDPRSPITSGTESDPNFIELLVLKAGVIYKEVRYSAYNIIADTLARRTYDESGDYTVRPFLLDIKEYLDNGSNEGVFQMYMYLENEVGFSSPVGKTITQGAVEAEVTYYNEVTGKLQFIKTSTTPDEFDSGSIELYDGITLIGTADIQEELFDAVYYPKIYGQPTIGAHDSSDYSSLIAVGIEPGKAYVRGYEIEKIAKHYIPLSKARTVASTNNKTIATVIGNSVTVDHLRGSVDLQTFQTVDLYDKYYTTGSIPGSGELAHKIGSAKIKNIELNNGVPGTDEAIYKLYIHDVSLKSGRKFEEVKYICKTGSPNFTCHVYARLWKCIGKVKISGTTSVTFDGYGTRFLKELNVGDVIVIFPEDAANRIEIYVDTITNDIVATGTVIVDTGGSLPLDEQVDYFAEFAILEAPQGNNLVFRFPNVTVKAINDVIYYTNRLFSSKTTDEEPPSSGNYYLNLNTPNNEEFLAGINNNYLICKNTGEIIEPESIVPNPLNLSECKIKVTDAGTYNIIAGLKLGSGLNTIVHRMKTEETASKVLSTLADATQDVILLDHVDVYEIDSIRMSPSIGSAPLDSDPDIKDRYTLDTGQRDNLYDYGRIIKLPGTATPVGQLKVTYKYFGHDTPSATKTFYCSDSYPNYENVTSYVSASSGERYNLRDCLDFRPDINNLTEIYTPKPSYNFQADYDYYLNRIDSLWVDSKGIFQITQGVPGLKPIHPDSPRDGMVLYNLNIKSYTFKIKDVIPEYIENKRYTMRDIGRLEKRIENIEYYTVLNELEKQTKDLLIPDDQGLDRFKHGFIVDNFSTYEIADQLNKDIHYTIDIAEGVARPEFVQQNINLVSYSSSNTVLTTGNIIMLPYTSVEMINQPYATTTENVNPYNVFTYIGYIELNPPFDEWKDTERLPDKIVPGGGNFESMQEYNDSFGGIHWNDWETTWEGSTLEKWGDSIKWVGQTDAYNLGIQFPMYHYGQGGIPITPETVAAGLIPGITDASQYPVRIPSASDPFPLVQTQNERWTEALTTKLKTTKRGVKTSIVPVDIQQDMGDKVVGVDLVSYMRAREILYSAKRMKPNTRLYAFFDAGGSNINNVSDLCTNLITDDRGEVSGTFSLPGGKFKTGVRVFRLTDKSDNSPDTSTRAEAQYTASGIIEKKQRDILSIRNADVVTEHINDEDLTTWTTLEEKEKQILGPWYDPVAQTFLVDSKGGAYITKIDIFFESKDANIPIELQIREVVNGYPGSKILPFGRKILYPSAILTSSNASVATSFVFPSPVYVMDKTEYAICLVADSNSYNVFIATKTPPIKDGVAKNVIITPVEKAGEDLRIEPYMGSFFKSQNSSTWTAEQESDLKFVVHKARFFDPSVTTRSYGTYKVVNDSTASQYQVTLQTDALNIKSGFGILRVKQPNHGMSNGSRVTINGIENLSIFDGVNYTPITQLNNRPISNVDLDSYTIIASSGTFSMTGNPTYSGPVGGSNMISTKDFRYDVMNPIIGELLHTSTTITYTCETSELGSGYLLQPAIDITANSNIEFETPKTVASPLNVLGINGKVFITCALTTENENVSPIIDLNRFSAILVANRLNDPTESTYNIVDFDDVTIAEDIIDVVFDAVSGTITIPCADETEATTYYNKFVVGKYITTTSINTPNQGPLCIEKKAKVVDEAPDPDEWFVVLTVSETLQDSTETVDIVQKDRFVNEVGPMNTSSVAKYITKRMSLTQECTALKVLFAAYRDSSATIEVYYKLLKTHDDRNFDEIEYKKATFDSTAPASLRFNDLRDYETTISGLDPFIAVAFKIVMKGTNTSKVPRLKDFRAIGLDV